MPIMPERFIDGFSIPLIFVLLALAGMAVYEIGFRLGRWHQARTRDEQEGFADTLVGALLALLAFLLAFTVGMASSRFDARNDLALREANAIQTAYLRAMMLPEPFAENARELLREYVPLRVREADRAVNEANLRQTLAIQGSSIKSIEFTSSFCCLSRWKCRIRSSYQRRWHRLGMG